MTRIFGGILPYEAEVAEPDGPRIAAWVLADYADRADAIFQKWLVKHDAQVAAKALEDAADRLDLTGLQRNSEMSRWEYDTTTDFFEELVTEWLRARADQIEKGGQP